MAPVAAWLTHGLPPGEFGPAVRSYKRLKTRQPVRSRHEITGEILYQDRFGNMMTNIPSSMVQSRGTSKPKPGMTLHLGPTRIDRLVTSYAEVKDGRPFFLVNSQGLLEIAVREGSAAEALGAKPGDPLAIRLGR